MKYFFLFLTIVFNYQYFVNNNLSYLTSDKIKELDSHSRDFLNSVISNIACNDIDTLLSKNFKSYSTIGWLNAIDVISNNNNIIAINEDHLNPSHRLSVSSILSILKNNGFTHIAIEGLSLSDTLINERGYPKYLESGNYIREPNFGNFIRKAIELEFVIFGYDSTGPNREYIQAENICDKVFQDEINKLLIYAGHDHILENIDKYLGKTMVMNLEELLSTEIFTISQTEFDCHPFKYDPNICFERFFVLYNSKTNSFFSNNNPNRNIDMVLFELKDKKSCKSCNCVFSECMYFNKYKKPDNYNGKCLLIAFDLKEEENPVPIDVIEYDTSNDGVKPELKLRKGNYRIECYSSENNLLYKDIYEIK